MKRHRKDSHLIVSLSVLIISWTILIVYLGFNLSIDYAKGRDFVSEPIYKTEGSVGSDLFSVSKYLLLPKIATAVCCGLSIKIPTGYFGLVSGRSSMALKGIFTHVGIIDNDYRHAIAVILINLNEDSYEIQKGGRIGQISFLKFSQANFNQVSEISSQVGRKGGFGSTGF